jgi:NADH dehydrogenase
VILVTGGTGFIGQHLVRQLILQGYEVRILLRPSPESPNLPTGLPVQVAVSSLNDRRGLRAALKGINMVVHLAGTETLGIRSNLEGVDIEGTRTLSITAKEAGINRFLYLSHLGADKASAFPVLKAKGIAESVITHSGIDSTIFRSAVVFGPNDHFTNVFAQIIQISPFALLIPGNGSTLLQPIWVQDLVTCMVMTLDDPASKNKTYLVGGSETISFLDALELIMDRIKVFRRTIPIPPGYLRLLSVWLEQSRRFPISAYWIDYLAADRICPLDSCSRNFNLIPARFHQSLTYLSPKYLTA